MLVDLSQVKDTFYHLKAFDEEFLFGHAVDWALLCVLEDKLGRLIDLDPEKEQRALVEEFECIREWSPFDHPRWLAFEVEQQLQIRPYQYKVVRQLLDEPGSMVQLNMGMGKTRVLVPMLILEWASTEWLTRLNVLPQILHEAVEYYRKALVSSVQTMKLFTLPFHRSMTLDVSNESIISDELRLCHELNGFLVVSPQHRNSLLLKQYDHKVFVKGLALPTRDIIDESDAILHYNFQLVYALGDQVPLPDGPSRWNAMESLIVLLSECDFESLTDPKLVYRARVRPGTFPKLRFLQPFLADEVKRRELGRLLCRHLVHDPPYEFRWMRLIDGDDDRKALVDIFCQPELDAKQAIECNVLYQKHKQDVLAIRGCIAYGLLFHAMQARHRVNYGLSSKSGKKLAVPFSASETPKDRSEFSHPDMAVLYSTLSYLHTGLSFKQFESALKLLLEQGPTARRIVFQEWINAIENGVDSGTLKKFDAIEKIDL
ncbi:MAG: hypothetical protein SGILL_004248, partial [Bacillariaceae sp.]